MDFVRTTLKLMQLQIETVDRKFESDYEIGGLTIEIVKILRIKVQFWGLSWRNWKRRAKVGEDTEGIVKETGEEEFVRLVKETGEEEWWI